MEEKREFILPVDWGEELLKIYKHAVENNQVIKGKELEIMMKVDKPENSIKNSILVMDLSYVPDSLLDLNEDALKLKYENDYGCKVLFIESKASHASVRGIEPQKPYLLWK